MRPGPIRPGNPPLAHLGQAGQRASMRPGPIRPGNGAVGLDRRAGQVASMRPGPIRPGNAVTGQRPPPLPPGFNEARADSPGKCRTTLTPNKMLNLLQ